MATPKLDHVLTLRAYGVPIAVPAGKVRDGPLRTCHPLNGGFLRGVDGTETEGLSVELTEGGSDWISYDPSTNIAHVDVRTHGTDGAGDGFYIRYSGYLQGEEIGQKFLGDWSAEVESTNYGDHYWWTHAVIETGSEKYKSLTTTFLVGQGRWYAGEGKRAVEYKFFKVSNGV
ncbi:uncharacterized protein BHQ10_001353 [Talaromyces amestolkiae]|uniref:Uncharacterized protein n=1 Tax=Talaromyces amestolkiae TaxID=1196081 RepID=A0A364KPA3_TALAM|nr:uncharacterized protein BHQ10_001353 [Talaromyces amestolkiae]RAO65341.1 hypothetical protein BHQ10_001353 [Talaromyces amestolkiae]